MSPVRFREEGVRVPEDIAIVAFGDYFIFGGEFYNELTSIRQPDVKKGQKAAEMLFEMMDKPELMQKPKNVILEPEIAKRRSCGCS